MCLREKLKSKFLLSFRRLLKFMIRFKVKLKAKFQNKVLIIMIKATV
jgi:hypothetical protein